MTPLTDPGRAQPAFVVRARVGMTDSDFPSISVLNRASLAALGERLGRPLAMERFRGNVWLEGLAPFAEFDLVGARDAARRRGAGGAGADHPLRRDDASIPRPGSATRTRSAGSRPGWGHQDFGVYAEVVEGGRVAVGDAAAVAVKPGFALAPEPDAEALERGRLLFAGPCEFLKGVVAMDGLPPADRVEVCFAGRSNVGKSSLINALTGRQGAGAGVEHAGADPGDQLLRARARRTTSSTCRATASPRRRSRWWSAGRRCCADYLAGRPTLRRAFLLVDARHGVKAVDGEIMALLDRAAVTFQVVLTKADKPGEAALAATIAGLGRGAGAASGGVSGDW